MKPIFDKEGYPAEEFLTFIENYDDYSEEGLKKLLDLIMQAWKYPEYCAEKHGLYVFATGGWSGNEDLMEALSKNVIWNFVKHIYLEGGLWVIGLSDKAKEIIDEKRDELTKYFWNLVRMQNEVEK